MVRITLVAECLYAAVDCCSEWIMSDSVLRARRIDTVSTVCRVLPLTLRRTAKQLCQQLLQIVDIDLSHNRRRIGQVRCFRDSVLHSSGHSAQYKEKIKTNRASSVTASRSCGTQIYPPTYLPILVPAEVCAAFSRSHCAYSK